MVVMELCSGRRDRECGRHKLGSIDVDHILVVRSRTIIRRVEVWQTRSHRTNVDSVHKRATLAPQKAPGAGSHAEKPIR